MRVISLLPSATEILAFIGASDMLAGRSHECDFPASIMNRPVLTSAKTTFQSSAQADRAVSELAASGHPLYAVDEKLLQSLKPDVILTQDLCRVCSIDLATVQRLAAAMDPPPKIVSLDPHTVEGVIDDVLTVGEAVGMAREAQVAATAMREELYRLSDYVNPFDDGPNVAMLEWCDPLFIGGHWTPQLIERAGARHPLNATQPVEGSGAAAGPIGLTQRAAGKSVRVPPEVLVASRPEYLVIAPCGLTLEQTRLEVESLKAKTWWRELPAVRNGRAALVDGNQYFNRPGPRLVDAFAFLVGWLNGRTELVPEGFAWEVVR